MMKIIVTEPVDDGDDEDDYALSAATTALADGDPASARLGCDSSTLYSPSPPRDPSSVQGRRLIHILPFHPAMWREKAACACQQMAPRTEHRRDGDVLMCEQQTRFRVPVGAKTRRLRRPHSLRSTRAHVS
jgi:hypothetical protein